MENHAIDVFEDVKLGENAQLAIDNINQVKTKGIPGKWLNIMQHEYIEYFARTGPGSYIKNPEDVYLKLQKNIGTCFIDQYIPRNPLTMGNKGYEAGTVRKAATGAAEVRVDNILIDSPEAVVEHIESYALPRLKKNILNFNDDERTNQIIHMQKNAQIMIGPDILKTGYGFVTFPHLNYTLYGYENYFMAYALYPDVIEKLFKTQADYAYLNNKAAARAYKESNMPLMYRLDHDMADGRGTLVDIKSLDRIWMPHFTRCIEPVVNAGVKLVWHCDGNLMELIPRLIDAGIKGFQGFQYEYGMNYETICGMKDRDGNGLIIMAGVSVTNALPHGKPDDIRRELKWLVENGPATGLFLGCSSSVTPGVPFENLKILIEGMEYYRKYGRKGI